MITLIKANDANEPGTFSVEWHTRESARIHMHLPSPACLVSEVIQIPGLKLGEGRILAHRVDGDRWRLSRFVARDGLLPVDVELVGWEWM